jgi:hypothetical protein
VPFAIENANRFWGEKAEEAAGEIETTVGASWALVHYNSLGRFTVVGHGNAFEAVRARVPSAILRSVQGDNKVALDVILSTGTKADIIKGPPSAREAFMQLNIARLAFRDLLVTAVVDRPVGDTQGSQRKRKRQ